MKKLISILGRAGRKRLIAFLAILLFLFLPLFAGSWGDVWNGLKIFTGIILAPATFGASLSITASGVAGIAQSQADKATKEKEKLEEQQKYREAYDTAYDNYASQQSQVNSLNASIAQTEAEILQTEANISAYDQSLVRWQSQLDQQRQSLQAEGEAAYSELMENWQGAELLNATRGQTGGSAALVAESQAAQIERLAGKDMLLDDDGGIFGTAMSEFRLDMLAGRTELVGNMRIQQEALKRQQSALASYKSSLSLAQDALERAKNNVNSARDQAINSGIDESTLGGRL